MRMPPTVTAPHSYPRADRTLALKHHPDKGGDPEVFKSYAEAYAVLSDPETRAAYDDELRERRWQH